MALEFTIKGDKIKGSGDFNPDVVVLEYPDGVRLTQRIAGKKSVILLSKKQAKELKDSL
jgi:hypothetical protein